MKKLGETAMQLAWEAVPVTLSFAAALALWQFLVWLFQVETYFIPAPTDVARSLWLGREVLFENLLATLYSTLMAFVIAVVLGVFLGAIVSEIKWVRKTIYPLLIALQSMPRIALTPMIVVWFGFGYASKIVTGVFSAFFPIFLNTVQGLNTVDHDQIALMRSLRATRSQIFWKVKLPNALPFLLAGANIAIIFAMLSVIVAEFLGSNIGMGFLIVNESSQMDTGGVFANVIILSVVGLLLHYALEIVRHRLLFWSESNETERVKT